MSLLMHHRPETKPFEGDRLFEVLIEMGSDYITTGYTRDVEGNFAKTSKAYFRDGQTGVVYTRDGREHK